MDMNEKVLIGLRPEEYEHPFDKAALSNLKKCVGLEAFTNAFLNWVYVRWQSMMVQGSNFHVTLESYPDLYNLARKVAKVLSVEDFPEIYTEWGYQINGYTTGTKERTIMVLNSGAIDLLSDRQLEYVVGHEMGHIKSGHVLYHQMATLMQQFLSSTVGQFLTMPIQCALMYWYRMSEFTADRAGLLACQDKDEAIRAIMKMAGVPRKFFGKINEQSFIKQAEEFETLNSQIFDSAIRNLSILMSTHPWTVYRAGELLKWVQSGEYDKIISEHEGVPCIHCGNIVAKNATYCHVHGGHPFE